MQSLCARLIGSSRKELDEDLGQIDARTSAVLPLVSLLPKAGVQLCESRDEPGLADGERACLAPVKVGGNHGEGPVVEVQPKRHLRDAHLTPPSESDALQPANALVLERGDVDDLEEELVALIALSFDGLLALLGRLRQRVARKNANVRRLEEQQAQCRGFVGGEALKTAIVAEFMQGRGRGLSDAIEVQEPLLAVEELL